MTGSAHEPLTLELKDEGGQDELSVRRRQGGHRRRRRRRRRRQEGKLCLGSFLRLSTSCLLKVVDRTQSVSCSLLFFCQ